MPEKKMTNLGRGALLLATLIWGSSFVVLKNTLDVFTPFRLLTIRFTVGGILIGLLGWKDLKKLDRSYLWGGVLMGLFLFGAYAFQTYGLVYTTPGINAFLTATYSVIVPFLGWAIYRRRPDQFNIAAAVIALVGVGLVSLNGQMHVSLGELLTLVCGLFFALHILVTDRYVKERSVLLLTMVQFFTAAFLCLGGALLAEPAPQAIPSGAVWNMLYLCFGCTALCYLCQNFGQKQCSASTSAVILTLESVFGAFFSAILYNEQMTLRLILGFALIFVAVLVSETKLAGLRRLAVRRRMRMGMMSADAASSKRRL